MAEDEAPAPAASESTTEPSVAEKDFARRAARAELDAQGLEDERRAALSKNELANYERALGAPIVKGE